MKQSPAAPIESSWSLSFSVCRAERGMTLIEVIVSTAILAAAMMTAFTIYTQCIVELRRARNRTHATHYAQMMMEEILSTPHAVSSYHGLTTSVDPPSANPVRDDLLRWKRALREFPTSASGAISVSSALATQTVTVAITYDDYGRTRTNTLVLQLPSRRPPHS